MNNENEPINNDESTVPNEDNRGFNETNYFENAQNDYQNFGENRDKQKDAINPGVNNTINVDLSHNTNPGVDTNEVNNSSMSMDKQETPGSSGAFPVGAFDISKD